MNTASYHGAAERRIEMGFFIHLGAFVGVNLGLAALNLSRNPDQLWFPWVLAGWGAGVLFHGAAVCFNGTRERVFERVASRMERRDERQERREERREARQMERDERRAEA